MNILNDVHNKQYALTLQNCLLHTPQNTVYLLASNNCEDKNRLFVLTALTG